MRLFAHLRTFSRLRVISVLCLLVALAGALTIAGLLKGMVRAAGDTQHSSTKTTSLPSSTVTCGIGWQVVPSPNVGTGATADNSLKGVMGVSSDNVWAVGDQNGNTLIEHWNGKNWKIVPSPNVGTQGDFLQAVSTISSSDIWAVGAYFTGNPGATQTLIEHWNGTQWSVVPSPTITNYEVNVLQGITAVSPNDIWAVGYSFVTSDSTSSDEFTLIVHWNGTQWTIVSSANVQFETNGLNSAVAISSNDVWAVGSSSGDGGSTFQSLIEHWNGTQWSISLSSPFGSDQPLAAVSGIATNDVWAVGHHVDSTGHVGAFILHWDGSQWLSVNLTVPAGYSSLSSVVAISADNAWAIGSDNSTVLIVHWNGHSWNVIANPAQMGSDNYVALGKVPGTNKVWTVGHYLTIVNGNVVARTLTAVHC